MRFKAALTDAKGLLGVLQVCRSIQRDCIIRLQSDHVRFFSNTNAADGVQVWVGRRASTLFSDMICESRYEEQSITCEVLDLAQLIHIVKQAEARERPHQGGGAGAASHAQIRLAKNGKYPVWRVAMQGLDGQPDVSFDVPLRILGDREIQGMSPPSLERQHLQILIPDVPELTTFIDKLKNTAAENVTFSARVLAPSKPRRGTETEGGEDNDFTSAKEDSASAARRGRKRLRGGNETPPLASLIIHAEHVMARFALQYEAVELLQPPERSDSEDEDEDTAGEVVRMATATVETRKFARFFSAVKEIDPMKMSMYVVDRRALVLSVLAEGRTTMVAYIPAKV